MTREQLVAAGFSNGAMTRCVEGGRLQRLHRGVYVLGHRALAPWARELAAAMAIGADAVVSHRSAASLWGMRADAPRVVDVTVPNRKVGHRSGIGVHRSTRISTQDLTSSGAVPVTTPERTLVDLAGPARGRAGLEDGRRQRLFSEAKLRDAIARAGRTAGAAAVAAVLADEGEPAVTRSELERRVRAPVRAAGLPPPTVNSRVAGHEVDLWWPRHGLIVEVDSWPYHSSRAAFERDRAKQAGLVAAGLTVLRLTSHRVSREPQAAVAALAGALARAESRGPPSP